MSDNSWYPGIGVLGGRQPCRRCGACRCMVRATTPRCRSAVSVWLSGGSGCRGGWARFHKLLIVTVSIVILYMHLCTNYAWVKCTITASQHSLLCNWNVSIGDELRESRTLEDCYQPQLGWLVTVDICPFCGWLGMVYDTRESASLSSFLLHGHCM